MSARARVSMVRASIVFMMMVEKAYTPPSRRRGGRDL